MFLLLPLPSIYSGHQSILVPPLELESNVSLWLSAVSQYKVRVTFCSYSVMEICTKGLGTQTDALRVSGPHFSTYWHKQACIFLKSSFWLGEDEVLGVPVRAFHHYDLIFGECWDCWKIQLPCFSWKKKSHTLLVWVTGAISVLLDVFDILGKIHSKLIKLFVSETRKKPNTKPKKIPDKIHTNRRKNP